MADDHPPSEVGTLLLEELDSTSRDLVQIRGLVADAVVKMGSGFERIVGETRAQQQLLEDLLTQVSDGERRSGRVSQFIVQSERLLGEVSNGLEKASERVLHLATRLDTIDATFRKLTGLTDAVIDVSKEIRVLAFNAHLEATRAGQGGKGFSVVANAVRELSENFRALTEEIHDAVSDARESIADTVAETRCAAAADRTTVQRSREEMGRLHDAIATLNREMAVSLQSARKISNDVRCGVNECIKGLQFDDLIGQLCQGTEKRLEACRSVVAACSSGEAPLGAVAAGDVTAAKMRELGAQHRAVHQTSLDAGDVEFF